MKPTLKHTFAGLAIFGSAIGGGLAVASGMTGNASAQDSTTTVAQAPTTAAGDNATASNSTANGADNSTANGADNSTAADPGHGRGPADGQTPPGGPRDESKGGHQANGKTEVLLTGDAATKATAAANQAVPGGTILRVETDAEGTNEAHVRTSDGKQVTVKLDADFKVTSVENGPR
jgi:hypothetical protein